MIMNSSSTDNTNATWKNLNGAAASSSSFHPKVQPTMSSNALHHSNERHNNYYPASKSTHNSVSGGVSGGGEGLKLSTSLPDIRCKQQRSSSQRTTMINPTYQIRDSTPLIPTRQNQSKPSKKSRGGARRQQLPPKLNERLSASERRKQQQHQLIVHNSQKNVSTALLLKRHDKTATTTATNNISNNSKSNNNGDELLINSSLQQQRKTKASNNARRSLSLNDAHCHGIEEMLGEFMVDTSDDDDEQGEDKDRSASASDAASDEAVDDEFDQMQTTDGRRGERIRGELSNSIKKKKQYKHGLGIVQEEPLQQQRRHNYHLSRRHTTTSTIRPTLLQLLQSKEQQQEENDGSELLVMSSNLDKSITTSSHHTLDKSITTSSHHTSDDHDEEDEDCCSSTSRNSTNDGNELLAMSSSTLMDDEGSMISRQQRRRLRPRSNTITTATSNNIGEKEKLRTQQRRHHQKKASSSNARRSLSMNDAYHYQTQEFEYEIESESCKEEEGHDETTKREKKNQRPPRHQRCIDNNVVAAASAAIEECSTSIQQPKKKQPLKSSMESDDTNCTEINRIYNSTPQTVEEEEYKEQEQPQHSSPPPPPPPLPPIASPPQAPSSQPTSSNYSTNSNNSIMEDYIQLKLKVAELQSDLQHFQAETSRYKVDLIHLYKENEELQRENELLLYRQQGNAGADDVDRSELKKENDFMKRILYNLERLGKIDKVDDLLKSRLEDEEDEILSGFRNMRDSCNEVVGGGNQRPLSWPLHSSVHSSRSNSSSGLSQQQPPAASKVTNGPPQQRRGSNLFRRLAVPFAPPANSDDNIMEVEELPMTDTTSIKNDKRIRRRSFSSGSLSSLFRWPTEENQDTSSIEAAARLDQSGRSSQSQQRQPRRRSFGFGETIKNIQRSFSPNNINDPTKANTAASTKDDTDKTDVPEFVHTDEEVSLLQMSEISVDVVPSSRIPTMGLLLNHSSHCNVDIRQTAKQASTTRPTTVHGRERGLFGSFMRDIIREES